MMRTTPQLGGSTPLPGPPSSTSCRWSAAVMPRGRHDRDHHGKSRIIYIEEHSSVLVTDVSVGAAQCGRYVSRRRLILPNGKWWPRWQAPLEIGRACRDCDSARRRSE